MKKHFYYRISGFPKLRNIMLRDVVSSKEETEYGIIKTPKGKINTNILSRFRLANIPNGASILDLIWH